MIISTNLLLIIFAALLPAIVLALFINYKDAAHPEPTKWLVKAFIYGGLSVLVSLLFSTPTARLLGPEYSGMEFKSASQAFTTAFCLAAIPEETAKLIMFLLLVWKNPYFDDRFDGIVYAVCIGLGFAAFENVEYVIRGAMAGAWLPVAVSRAFTAIPGHFLFAVLMGYNYSLYKFGIDRSKWRIVLILLAPVLAHGLYDGILMSANVNEALSGAIMIVFLLFFNRLRIMGKERINTLS